MWFLALLRDKRGAIDLLPQIGGNIVVTAIILSVSLSALGAMAFWAVLNNAAWHISRMIEVDGCYDAGEQQRISEFMSNIHLGAQVSVSPDQNSYNLGDSFTVTLSESVRLGGNNFSLALPIYGRAGGTSEVYQK